MHKITRYSLLYSSRCRKSIWYVRVELFIKQLIEKIGLSGNMTYWLKAIYNKLQPRIQVNDLCMETYLTRGVRQGCPLSPLLFNICIETLAIAIREGKLISGFQIKGKKFKIVQYADGRIFWLTSPIVCLLILFLKLNLYRKLVAMR